MIQNLLTAVIPMPIYMGHHGGHLTASQLMAIPITFNIVFILYFVVRAIIWKVKKPANQTFYQYTIMSGNLLEMFPDMNTIMFFVVNGVVLFMTLAIYVSTLL